MGWIPAKSHAMAGNVAWDLATDRANTQLASGIPGLSPGIGWRSGNARVVKVQTKFPAPAYSYSITPSLQVGHFPAIFYRSTNSEHSGGRSPGVFRGKCVRMTGKDLRDVAQPG